MSLRRHRTHLRRATVLVGSAALVVGGLVGVSSAEPGGGGPAEASGFELGDTQPTLTGRVSADKAPSSALARTPRSLTKLTSPDPVLVMIKLDYDALASYTGTVRGLAATSPSVTKQGVTASTDAVRDYQGYVASQESTITGRMRAAVPGLEVGRSYQVVYGGVAATVPGNQISRLLEVPGVVAVQRDSLRQPLTDSSTDFVNAPAAYDQLPGGRRDAGTGILLANIDSGVWPEHPSFDRQRQPPGQAYPARGGASLRLRRQPAHARGRPVRVQQQARRRLRLPRHLRSANNDDDLRRHRPRRDGHGSHTASTSAGNIVERRADPLGVDRARPSQRRRSGCRVVEYKVCGLQRLLRSATPPPRSARRSSTAPTSSTSPSAAARPR